MIRIWCVWLSIFVSTIIASARADDFPIKKLSHFTWVVDYEPFWSPDSLQIVLISSRHGGMKVHVMNADSASHGSDMHQLTFGSDEDDSPAWSPDGKKIAFVSIRAGVSQIFVMNADGANVRQLTNGQSAHLI
jgi:Tol biopolymer transport system component